MQDQRKLSESERRRLIELRAMVPAAEVLALVAALGAAVERHVPDEAARRAIAAELVAVANRAAPNA